MKKISNEFLKSCKKKEIHRALYSPNVDDYYNNSIFSTSYISSSNSSSSPTFISSNSNSPENEYSDDKKFNKALTQNKRFQSTIQFISEYLDDVVKLDLPFEDKERNKLTFEVIWFNLIL